MNTSRQEDPQLSEANLVIDVREDLRAGREPFPKIMQAADEVPVGGTLTLYATFKPTPLIAVLQSQGFTGETSHLANGDWQVVFSRAGDPAAPAAPSPNREVEKGGETTHLDNRGLEPPQPMVRTLEAIASLKPGHRIVGHYDRKPMFLLPKLEEMGFTYDVTQHEDGTAEVTITAPVKA